MKFESILILTLSIALLFAIGIYSHLNHQPKEVHETQSSYSDH